ncbi:MAG: ergothioneine biosynthesis protein EgtB [Acidobacteriota bacterium]|nr:MAG: ergothioneine biosynthesis protein EgtB [Acidobacteriota bacterium]
MAQTVTAAETRHLLDRYRNVRSRTVELCEPLEIEDYIPQPIVDVSPPKWNIAHTTWFFEEMILKKYSSGYKPFDPLFGFLFNSYYNTVGERTARDQRGNMSRPTVKRVFEYREYVDAVMAKLLASTNGVTPLEGLVELGLNHEEQHQELFLTDLKYTFSLNPAFPAYRPGFAPEEITEDTTRELLTVGEGIYEIGHNRIGFCFDNELGRHKVYLQAFEIADTLITNREYLEFISEDGYRDHRLWHAEGWDWLARENVNAPLYWREIDGEWHQFTLGGLRELPLDAPVCHVSFYEAAAFAEWKGMRLPTEFEWEIASDQFSWGKRWEWTNSAYLPYPGFSRSEGAVGEYNGKFMVNQMVLRGASIATPPGHSRPTYRNFFHPHLRWQFTGIRLAK